jgi:molybdate transport repressor ModE-like protein
LIAMNDQWAELQLQHLETLRAIARTGSFRAAADETDQAQSVVSKQVAVLEAIVGMRLVDRGRGRRNATLTEAGEVLVRHADAVAARLSAAHADLLALADGSAGRLRVGTYQSVSARILPSLLGRFAERWPRVHVELRESSADRELLSLLESGALDLAFSGLPLAEGPFDWSEVLRDAWFLLTTAGSPLASRPAPLSVRELQGVPLIGFHATGSAQIGLEELLHASGLVPQFVFRTNDNVTVQGLVANGIGSALMPALAIDTIDPRVVRIPVEIPFRCIAIAWHADRTQSPAAAAFVALAHEVCAELAETSQP